MRTQVLINILKGITPESSLQDISYAVNLVQCLRPLGEEQYPEAEERVAALCDILEKDNALQGIWSLYLSGLFSSRSFARLFTELGLPSEHRFFDELRKRAGNMMLPPLSDKGEALDLLSELFNQKGDNNWINHVTDLTWERLFNLLLSGTRIRQILKNEVMQSMQILANRIASLGLEPVLLERLAMSGNKDSAFLSLSKEVFDITRKNEKSEAIPEDFKHLKVIAGQCLTIVANLRKRGRSQGVSIRMVYLLIRIERNIDRLIMLTSLLEPTEDKPTYDRCLLFKKAVNDLHRGHSIRELFNDTTGLLAYQVVEHNSQTGEHYITTNAREYWHFLYQSAMGGVVIGITTLLKMMIQHLQRAPFVEAALYGLNYAASFSAIFLGHFALATKQPSMTASALATALDDEKGRSKVDIEETGFLIIDMFRSQFISFFGNLVTVFPMAIFMAFLYLYISGYALINESKALKLLNDINPFETPVIWYGAIAGFCLFLSGLFTGYINNSLIFNKIPERIRAHKKLVRWVGFGFVSGVADWTERNWAGVSGNILLGFMLGFAGFFGFIFGLPFDIRHITLAAGSFGVAVYSLSFQLTVEQWLFPLIGIFLIGFMNFIVSFGLSLLLALRSRKVNFKETRNLMFFVIGQSLYHPSLLFLPPAGKKNTEVKTRD